MENNLKLIMSNNDTVSKLILGIASRLVELEVEDNTLIECLDVVYTLSCDSAARVRKELEIGN